MAKIERGLLRFSNRMLGCMFFLIFQVVFVSSLHFEAEAAGINNTKHNLSITGPGPVKSLTENRICVFCHTPHNAYELSPASGGPVLGSGLIAPEEYTYLPLWNHEVTTSLITQFYTSSTLKALQSQPTGPTKLCLSCHDGTVAIGAVASGQNLGITGKMSDSPAGPLSNIGTNLATHHPVSFPYSASLPNPELASIESLPSAVALSGNREVHCTTCHNAHDDTFGNFLVMDNSTSQLCESCHMLTGWNVAAHDNCEACHTPHFAANTGEWLLNFTSYDACLTCHSQPIVHIQSLAIQPQRIGSATVLSAQSLAKRPADIKTQVQKISSHRTTGNGRMLPQRAQLVQRRSGITDVTCVGCHNPHSANKKKASAPYASGMLQGVSGVDRNGVEVASVTYEYEVCFKCHGDYSPDFPYVPRVVTTNIRLAMDTGNPSYHPVVGIGKNFTAPSMPSYLSPTLMASDMIYCTDCHSDDAGGSRGPHGSLYPPILKERYETRDSTMENYQNYALCYRCHDRNSILRDSSFKKNSAGRGGHSGHLANGAPCSACHDPHGVVADGTSGSHTHLINFDIRIVSPAGGNRFPFYTDLGAFSGSCTLVCHGRTHLNETYPNAGISSQRRSLIPGLQNLRKSR